MLRVTRLACLRRHVASFGRQNSATWGGGTKSSWNVYRATWSPQLGRILNVHCPQQKSGRCLKQPDANDENLGTVINLRKAEKEKPSRLWECMFGIRCALYRVSRSIWAQFCSTVGPTFGRAGPRWVEHPQTLAEASPTCSTSALFRLCMLERMTARPSNALASYGLRTRLVLSPHPRGRSRLRGGISPIPRTSPAPGSGPRACMVGVPQPDQATAPAGFWGPLPLSGKSRAGARGPREMPARPPGCQPQPPAPAAPGSASDPGARKPAPAGNERAPPRRTTCLRSARGLQGRAPPPRRTATPAGGEQPCAQRPTESPQCWEKPLASWPKPPTWGRNLPGCGRPGPNSDQPNQTWLPPHPHVAETTQCWSMSAHTLVELSPTSGPTWPEVRPDSAAEPTPNVAETAQLGWSSVQSWTTNIGRARAKFSWARSGQHRLARNVRVCRVLCVCCAMFLRVYSSFRPPIESCQDVFDTAPRLAEVGSSGPEHRSTSSTTMRICRERPRAKSHPEKKQKGNALQFSSALLFASYFWFAPIMALGMVSIGPRGLGLLGWRACAGVVAAYFAQLARLVAGAIKRGYSRVRGRRRTKPKRDPDSGVFSCRKAR